MRKSRRPHLLVLGLTVLAFGAGFKTAFQRPPDSSFRWTPRVEKRGEEPLFQTSFASRKHDVTAHAASLVELGDGRLRAFWFSGSREGALDVEIVSATFDPTRDAWSESSVVVGPGTTAKGLWRHVTKVGNPAALRTSDGELWLFYVTVSIGGWGGSSVSLVRSRDEGETWSSPQRLIGAPFLNLNMMVQGAPFEYADGTVGLPAYQSLVRGFSEILRVDRNGSVIDKQRLSRPGNGSQPAVVPTSAAEALALMRPSGQPPPRRVLRSVTRDAGRHWTSPEKTPLINPDAGVEAIALGEGRVLVALNDVDVERDVLSLVITDDAGKNWTTLRRLENQLEARSQPVDDARYARTVESLARATDASIENPGRYVTSSRLFMCWEPRCHFEFSYPALIQARSGEFHLLYTWNRAYIKHVQFNRSWLDAELARAAGVDD